MAYNKYHAKKTVINDIVFDSKKEADRYCELNLLVCAGKISDLHRQVTFELVPKQSDERAVKYIADFVYMDNGTGKTIIEDVKGYHTKEYIIKRKIFKHRYPYLTFKEI